MMFVVMLYFVGGGGEGTCAGEGTPKPTPIRSDPIRPSPNLRNNTLGQNKKETNTTVNA